jgi:N-acetylmuramoyl-L-alanine amidase
MAEAAGKPAATEVQIAATAASTRVAIAFTEIPAFRIFTLVAPDRVVVDLSEVEFRIPDGSRIAGGPIKAMRYGLFQPGTSRMVLDLSQPSAVSEVTVEPGPDAKTMVLSLALRPVTAPEAASRSGKVVAATMPPPAALAAARVPTVKPAAPVERGRAVVVIDAGHGGVDPGAVGGSGIYEKAVTLAFAKEIKAQLERTGRYRVVLTRERDTFLRLRDRIEAARRAGAQLFISLHADSHRNGRFRGASVYTLSEDASDAEAAALAAKENKADVIAGVDLSRENEMVTNILIDLAQRETKNLSARFAALLVNEIGRDSILVRNTHRFAGFAVLKAPDVASVLLELGYLSNPTDEKLLASPQHRKQLAQSVLRAVNAYFDWQESLKRS